MTAVRRCFNADAITLGRQAITTLDLVNAGVLMDVHFRSSHWRRRKNEFHRVQRMVRADRRARMRSGFRLTLSGPRFLVTETSVSIDYVQRSDWKLLISWEPGSTLVPPGTYTPREFSDLLRAPAPVKGLDFHL